MKTLKTIDLSKVYGGEKEVEEEDELIPVVTSYNPPAEEEVDVFAPTEIEE